MKVETIQGRIPDIVNNKDGIYSGNLTSYFRAIFFNAQSLAKPYHNFRHTFDVFLMCYDACLFYQDKLSLEDKRNLLIAAMFHDFDHPGMAGHDDLNIERAIRGLTKYIQPEDSEQLPYIAEIIRATQFPYTAPSGSLSLPAQIIRDADMSQATNQEWVQQVIFGLAGEYGKRPIETLEGQVGFCANIQFCTQWAVARQMPEAIQERIGEIKAFLEILKV